VRFEKIPPPFFKPRPPRAAPPRGEERAQAASHSVRRNRTVCFCSARDEIKPFTLPRPPLPHTLAAAPPRPPRPCKTGAAAPGHTRHTSIAVPPRWKEGRLLFWCRRRRPGATVAAAGARAAAPRWRPRSRRAHTGWRRPGRGRGRRRGGGGRQRRWPAEEGGGGGRPCLCIPLPLFVSFPPISLIHTHTLSPAAASAWASPAAPPRAAVAADASRWATVTPEGEDAATRRVVGRTGATMSGMQDARGGRPRKNDRQIVRAKKHPPPSFFSPRC